METRRPRRRSGSAPRGRARWQAAARSAFPPAPGPATLRGSTIARRRRRTTGRSLSPARGRPPSVPGARERFEPPADGARRCVRSGAAREWRSPIGGLGATSSSAEIASACPSDRSIAAGAMPPIRQMRRACERLRYIRPANDFTGGPSSESGAARPPRLRRCPFVNSSSKAARDCGDSRSGNTSAKFARVHSRSRASDERTAVTGRDWTIQKPAPSRHHSTSCGAP